MMCECGATVVPYRSQIYTWCESCGCAYDQHGNRMPSHDTDRDAYTKNRGALDHE